ncbi:MAG: hypothetical protein ACFFAN_16885 [Promethearchaeota archaeon]
MRIAISFKRTPYYDLAIEIGFYREHKLINIIEEKRDLKPPYLP